MSTDKSSDEEERDRWFAETMARAGPLPLDVVLQIVALLRTGLDKSNEQGSESQSED